MNARFLRSFALTAGGAGAVAAVSLVRNVLIASVMGPAAFGLWNFCAVALRLTVESHLGALSTLAIDAPIHRGAGRRSEATALERAALSTTMILALVAGVAGAIALVVAGGAHLAAAAALLGATIVLQSLFFADATVLRTRGVFGSVAASQAAFAAVHIALLLWLVPERFLTGALAAWAAALLVAVGVMRFRAAEPMPPPLPAFGGGALVARGMPAYLVGVTFVVLLQTDRVIVGALLGQEALGYYGILGLGASALLFVPDSLGSVLWPMAGERFGRAGEEPASLGPLVERSVRGLAVVCAAALSVALAGTDLIVAVELPNFAPALAAARPYLAGIYLLALTIPLRFVLVTVGARRAALLAQVAAWTLALVLEAAACATERGLVGVATASAIAAFVLVAAFLCLAAKSRVVGTGVAIRLLAEAVALGAVVLAADAAVAGSGWTLRLAIPVAFGAAAALVLLRWRRETTLTP